MHEASNFNPIFGACLYCDIASYIQELRLLQNMEFNVQLNHKSKLSGRIFLV